MDEWECPRCHFSARRVQSEAESPAEGIVTRLCLALARATWNVGPPEYASEIETLLREAGWDREVET